MKTEKLLEAINYIREKKDNNKLIIFVGAGVSLNIEGMPSWYDLVKALADSINYSKCDDCRHRNDYCKESCRLREEYSNDDFFKIPQYVYNQDPSLYNEIIKKHIKDISVDAPLSKAIFNINPEHIITTNYDTLLETSSSELREQYQVIVRDKDLLNTTKNKYIIKMHGDLHDISSIVLKEQDYLNYSQDRVLIELFIKSLLTDHTVLFLGYSLNDYNIKQIISWLNYMRSQNGALEGVKVGYIVFDDDTIDERKQIYFEKNSIEIINIHNIPQVNNIPNNLKNEKGRRLYSFLSVVENQSLESNFEPQIFINSFLKFAKQYSYIDYRNLLKLLHIEKYEKKEDNLLLFEKSDYDKLKSYIECSTFEALSIKQLFINVGIGTISNLNSSNYEFTYKFSGNNQSTLFKEKVFESYITNDYNKLEKIISNDMHNPISFCFYHSFISSYDNVIYNEYEKIDFSSLECSQKITFLLNKAYLDSLKIYRANYQTVKSFINNISNKSERDCAAIFADILDGYRRKKNYIEKELSKLKKIYQGNTVYLSGVTLEPFYKIKNIVMELFNFTFYNNIFIDCAGAVIKEVFSLYIESVICVNSECSLSESNFQNLKLNKEKYPISDVDVDIMTKFISTKKLVQLLEDYHVKKLPIQFEQKYLLNIFNNLTESVLSFNTPLKSSVWGTFINLIVLINCIDLSSISKKQLEKNIVELFINKKFNDYFFSTDFPNYYFCLNDITKLCENVISKSNHDIVKAILNSKNFFDYERNIGHYNIRSFLKNFIKNEDENAAINIKTIIGNFENINQKITITALLFQSLPQGEIKEEIKEYVENNFASIGNRYLFDFMLGDFVDLSEEKINNIIDDIISLDDKQEKKLAISYPNSFKDKLEILYVLILTDKIVDISVLQRLDNLNTKVPFIEFILHPDTFDFRNVDFSNYMWVNFAKKAKYMDMFIASKETLTPKIQYRVREGVASEDEKKILYGFLLDKESIFKG